MHYKLRDRKLPKMHCEFCSTTTVAKQ